MRAILFRTRVVKYSPDGGIEGIKRVPGKDENVLSVLKEHERRSDVCDIAKQVYICCASKADDGNGIQWFRVSEYPAHVYSPTPVIDESATKVRRKRRNAG